MNLFKVCKIEKEDTADLMMQECWGFYKKSGCDLSQISNTKN